MKLLTLLALLLSPLEILQARDLKLPSIFSDHAVLQANHAAPVWGWADPGEQINVEFAGQKKTAAADATGKWSVKLDAMPASAEPRALTVRGKTTLMVSDVIVGEVWLASGQSNMEKPIGPHPSQHPCDDWERVVAESGNPAIRVFTVTRRTADKPAEDCQGKWEGASPATTARFTAAGYFFATEINKELKAPVGIIQSAWGGTRVEPWTSLDGFASDPELAAMAKAEIERYEKHPQVLKQYHEALAQWVKAHGGGDAGNKGANEDYANPAAPTSDWTPVNVGASKRNSIPPGVRWYRTTVTLPPEWKGKAAYLSLGAIQGFEMVYFNSTKLGGNDLNSAENIASPRKYLVQPRLIQPGAAAIAIRVVNYLPADAMMSQAWRTALVSQGPGVKIGPWLSKTDATLPLPDEAAIKSWPEPPPAVLNFDTASYIYNAMINPLAPYSIAGALWYQGESNENSSQLYRKTFPALISDWRAQWRRQGGEGEFPFYYCQLANYRAKASTPSESKWAEVREAQRLTLDKVPNTGMAVLIDIGEERDIHPTNKQDVGQRLALQALANTYGRKVESSGPLYKSATLEGGKIRVHFTHLGGGLIARPLPATYRPQSYNPATVPLVLPRPDSSLQGFAICGADGKFVWADAVIDGDTVVASSPEVARPVYLRYAWADNPTCNLYNAAGLPASPFRTDDFPK